MYKEVGSLSFHEELKKEGICCFGPGTEQTFFLYPTQCLCAAQEIGRGRGPVCS